MINFDPKSKETRHMLAEVISWAFFPPLVATVFFIFLIFWYSDDFSQGLNWIITIAPFLIFIPLIFFTISLKLGWISDVDLSNRKERPAFLAVFITSLMVATVILYLIHVPEKLLVYTLSGLIVTITTAFITLFWKISYHTTVTTSAISAIVILGGLRFAWLLFLIVPVAWARVALKKHTFWQVVFGAAVSFLITYLVFYCFGYRLFV